MGRNPYFSYSRIDRYQLCPLSYCLHYIDKIKSEPNVHLRFGKLIHSVFEDLVREHMEGERTGPLSADLAVDLYQTGWVEADLTGIELFQEGLDIINQFVCDQGVLEHRDVLAVEKKFQIQVGHYKVLGFIDRVDCVDDETVEIIDYKTNRVLFSREEVDNSLQMSIYALAARELWPWAKKIKLIFHMLRHGIRIQTARTEKQLQTARTYIKTMAEKMESASEFPARLNTYCAYCDHRQHCPAYADALKGKRKDICTDSTDHESVAKEREEVANLAKILYSRKAELDGHIKTHLKHHDELLVNGIRYKMFNTTRLEYPFEPTLRLFEESTGLSRDELVSRVAGIDKKAVDQLVKDTSKSRSHARLLKTELENVATKNYSPRLWAKRVSS